MTNTSILFTIPHFSDYGFDPQIDYFQVFEEARNHKRESSSFTSAINDNLHFKLKKPISKGDKKIKKTRKRWWNNALHFFKRKLTSDSNLHCVYGGAGVHSISEPVYQVESRSGSATAYHRTSTGGRWPGTITSTRKGDLSIPCVSLDEVNVDKTHKISASPMPIYLVT
ncbi:hypothetical protein R6Q59_032619 [Mikania micrantha]